MSDIFGKIENKIDPEEAIRLCARDAVAVLLGQPGIRFPQSVDEMQEFVEKLLFGWSTPTSVHASLVRIVYDLAGMSSEERSPLHIPSLCERAIKLREDSDCQESP